MPGSLFEMLVEKRGELAKYPQISSYCISLAGVFGEEEYPQLCDALLTTKDTRRILVLAEQFHKLGEAGFKFRENKSLYEMIVKSERPHDLAKIFIAFYKNGMDELKLQRLVEIVNKDPFHYVSNVLVDLLSALEGFGMIDGSYEFFNAAVEVLGESVELNAWYFDSFICAIRQQKSNDEYIKKEIIQLLKAILEGFRLKSYLDIEDIVEKFVALVKSERYLQKYKYALLSNIKFVSQLLKVFTYFKNHGSHINSDSVLDFVILNAKYVRAMMPHLIAFERQGDGQDFESFCRGVLEKVSRDEKALLEILSGEGFEQHKQTFIQVMDEGVHDSKLKEALIGLGDLGVSDECYNYFFKKIIEEYRNADTLLSVIQDLKDNGIMDYEKHKILFDAVIAYLGNDYVIKAFLFLYGMGFSHGEHQKLFNSMAEKTDYAKELVSAFSLLKDFGASTTEYESLFAAVIDNCHRKKYFVPSFNYLNGAGFSINNPNDRVYYEIVIRDPDMVGLILQLKGIVGKDVLLELCKLFSNNLATVSKISLELNNVGIGYADYPFVYQAFFQNFGGSVELISRMLSDVCSYAGKNDLTQDKGRHSEKFEKIIGICLQPIIPYGPLNKSQATQLLEKVITQIANTSVDKIEITFNENTGYVLTIENQPSIYLTLLLNQSNFTHIMLGEDIITLLLEKFAEILPLSSCGTHANFFSISPNELNNIINIYTQMYSLNINRLLRGQELDQSGYSEWPGVADNFLSYFLAGILTNIVANKLFALNNETARAEFSEYYTRREKDCPGLFRRRLANVQKQSTVLSFSRGEGVLSIKEGVFSSRNEIVMCCYPVSPIILNYMREVLIPAGTQLMYHPDSKNPQRLFVSVVCSPKYEKQDSYWSTLALLHAYEHHLKNEYKVCSHQIKINETEINRPNHGLAHTYRVQEAILSVINYFALHAKDEGFRDFCATISLEDLEYLRVAAAFRVTGRESEVSFHDNEKLYESFKQTSADHLRQFLDQHKLEQNISDDDIERLVDIVRYMGNPRYETELNSAEDGDREIRNYMHRVLTIAHNLDLLRCYRPDQFKSSMRYVKDLSQASDQQHRDYIALVQHQAALIKAHGDRLYTDVGIDGEFQSVFLDYRLPFDDVSHSIMALQQVSDTVPHLFFQDLPAPEVASQVQCQM